MNVDRESRILEIAKDAMLLPPEARKTYIREQSGDDPSMDEEIHFLVSILDMPQEQSFLSRAMHGALAASEAEMAGDASWRKIARPGEIIGLYRLEEPLGEGGMGSVFLAEQTEPVSRKVALKLVKTPFSGIEMLTRLKVEPQMMAMLSHPNIAQVYEVGSTPEGLLYFAMEYVDGEPITDYCNRHQIKLKDRLRILIQVCLGVQHAHQKAILHRDLKPSNILVTEIDGRAIAKIIDFGIASSVTESQSEAGMAGTPLYMSPEALLADGQGVDTRTDVYALGVLLFELITGVKPFDLKGLTVYSVMKKLANETIPVPSEYVSGLAADIRQSIAEGVAERPSKLVGRLRGELDWITAKAVARKREDRFESPRQLAQDLGHFLDGEPVSAAPAQTLYQARKYFRRNLLTIAVSGLVFILLIAGITARTFEANRAKAEAEKARIALAESEEVTAFLQTIFESARPDNHQGNEPSVRDLLDRGYERIGKAFPNQPLLRAKMLFVFSDVYTNLSDHQQEVTLLSECLALLQEHLPANHRDIAKVYSNLGLAYERRSQPEQAMVFQEKALAIYRPLLGDNHEETLWTRRHLAELNRTIGRFEQAETMLLKILASFQQNGEPNNIRSTRDYLSLLYMNLGRYSEAEALMRLVRQNIETQPNVNLRHIAGNHLRLGECLWHLGKYEEAFKLHQKALEMRRNIYGLDHRFTATTMMALGKSHFALRRLAEAEQLLQKAVVIQEKRSPIRATRALDVLGAVHIGQKRFVEAEQVLQRSLTLKQSLLGENDYRLSFTLRYVGDSYLISGRLEEAVPVFTQAKLLIEKTLGDEHPRLIPILTGLGNCEFQMKNYDRASHFLNRARTLSLNKLNPGTLDYQAAMQSYQQLLNQKKAL